MKMRVLDLFSGIGGFSLGLESTGHYRTAAFCEIEDYPRRILRTQWPDVEVFDDINSNGWLSMSGPLGGGEEGGPLGTEKWSGFSPDWILIENEGHRWRRWVPELRRALWKKGYTSLPIRVRADFMGFPHRRARVFLVANTDSLKLRKLQRWWLGEGREVAAKLAKPGNYKPSGLGADDGLARWLHMDFRRERKRGLGNAVIWQTVAVVGQGIAEVHSSHEQR